MVPFLQWLRELQAGVLQGWGLSLPDWVWVLVAAFIPVSIVWLTVQVVAGISQWVERKMAADIQCRVGVNQCNPDMYLGTFAREAVAAGKRPGAGLAGRALGLALALSLPGIKLLEKTLGRFAPGLLIFIADTAKLLMKEDLIPAAADKPLFRIAPYIVVMSAFGALACLPYSDKFYIADFNIGIFFIAAITSLEVVGILMAGWSSNNKWALLGGLRSAAQIVSYELPVGLTLLTAILLSGTMSMQGIVFNQFGPQNWQQGWVWQWNVFSNPFMLVLAPIYFLAALAECNRTPFDIPEAESELVAGYHTEYSGMRFALFFMAEYIMMCCVSAVAVTVFLGGWSTGIGAIETASFWAVNGDPAQGFYWWASLVHLVVFATKTYALVMLMMWIRWTLPRFRVDQMMSLCWRKLIPLSIACFTGVALWYLFRPLIVEALASGERPVAEAEGLLAQVTGVAALLIFVGVIGGLVRFFRRPLTPDEQVRRKLIGEANLVSEGIHPVV